MPSIFTVFTNYLIYKIGCLINCDVGVFSGYSFGPKTWDWRFGASFTAKFGMNSLGESSTIITVAGGRKIEESIMFEKYLSTFALDTLDSTNKKRENERSGQHLPVDGGRIQPHHNIEHSRETVGWHVLLDEGAREVWTTQQSWSRGAGLEKGVNPDDVTYPLKNFAGASFRIVIWGGQN